MSPALHGKRVLVTRAKGQNEDFMRQLAELGAIPVELPTIQIVPPDDLTSLDRTLAQVGTYDWLVFTSANAVEHAWQRLLLLGKTVSDLQTVRLAAIGPATAASLAQLGLTIELMPPEHIAEALLEAMPDIAGQRILLPTANIARPTLAKGLRAKGAFVDWVVAYQTQPAAAPADLKARLARVDILTFTSSSTVQNLVDMLKANDAMDIISAATIACIGPKTAQTVKDLGLPTHIVAKQHTISGLIESLANYYTSERRHNL
jgi:uroporphyrinogen-III synthase